MCHSERKWVTTFFWNNMWLGGDDKEGTVPEWRNYCKTRVVAMVYKARTKAKTLGIFFRSWFSLKSLVRSWVWNYLIMWYEIILKYFELKL